MNKKRKTTENGFPLELNWLETPDGDETPKQTKAAQPSQADVIAALQQQLGALSAQISSQSTLKSALMQEAPQLRPQFNTHPDLTNLPDPVTEPEGYARAVAQRFDQAYQAMESQKEYEREQQRRRSEQLEEINREFLDAYPGLRGHDELIEVAGAKVLQKAKRKGLDPIKYMTMNSDEFFKGVADEVQKIAPGIDIKGKIEDDGDDTDDLRTMGIPGGSGAGGRLSSGAEDDDEVPSGGLLEEIREFQIKTGYHG